MLITKKFSIEGSHIVRNCTTDKCSKSIHGHSYTIEVTLKASHLDKGGMVVDFSILKREVGDIIDSFDHSMIFWTKESNEFKRDMKEWSDRWIELPLTSSAECLSLQLFYLIDRILKNTSFKNNEDVDLKLYSVKVHETATGCAEAFREDISYSDLWLKDFYFSEAIIKSWKNPFMIGHMAAGVKFENPQPNKQINEDNF